MNSRAHPDPGEAVPEHLRSAAERTLVSEIMSKQVLCLNLDTPLDSVSRMFLERGISSAPVVDEHWRPMGMVSKTHLLRAIVDAGGVERADDAQASERPKHGEDATRVRDVLLPNVLSLPEEAPVAVAAALMAYEGCHRLPIVGTHGEVVGVVSTLDIIRWVARCTELEVATPDSGG